MRGERPHYLFEILLSGNRDGMGAGLTRIESTERKINANQLLISPKSIARGTSSNEVR